MGLLDIVLSIMILVSVLAADLVKDMLNLDDLHFNVHATCHLVWCNLI